MALPRPIPDETAEHCDSAVLDRYLSGHSSDAEAQRIEGHLDGCVACRERIERQAAAPEFWDSVAAKLDTRRDLSLPTMPIAAGYLQHWIAASDAPDGIGRIDHFELLDVIGTGGMGIVLRALDLNLGRQVALKTLRDPMVLDSLARQRFWREAQLAASVRHSNVVPILKIGSWRDVPYLVMPLASGGSLRDYVRANSLDASQIVDITRQIALALRAAHAQGMIHRDIKPSNILLLRGVEHVALADFGLARVLGDDPLTATGALLGTPQFMSPEQALGESVDPRSDLFSLGSLIYWMATGRSPFAAETTLASVSKVLHQTPPPLETLRPELPGAISRLVEHLTAKDPADRPRDAEVVVQWVERLSAHLHSPASQPLPPELAQPPKPRERPTRRLPKSLAAAIGLVALGVILGGAYFMGRPEPAATSALTPPVESTRPEAIEESTPSLDAPSSTATGPSRQGPLDELDRMNLMEDLKANRNTRYWLERLAGLPGSETPPSAIAWVERFAASTDPTVRGLAETILAKDPFEVMNPPDPDNPFELIDPP